MEELKLREIFESEILHKIMTDKNYFGSVVPYLKPKYFTEVGNSLIFKNIHEYYVSAGKQPNIKDLVLLIKDEGKTEKVIAAEALKKVMSGESVRAAEQLLVDKTEDFIKKAIHTESLILGAEAMGENNAEKLAESFRIAEEAQKVSLDEDFGLDLTNIDRAIDFYQDDTMGLRPGIVSFDKMIGKGFREKTLHMFLAAPGIGKSMGLSAFATEFLKQGKDVIVFSLEMQEEEWMKRIYSNLLDIPIADLEFESPGVIKAKFDNIKGHIGRLIIKEFPSYTLNSLHILNYLEKIETKLGISDPVVFVDYLGLMNSSRLQAGTNSYEYIKSITAELRAVAQRRNITIFSASQLNRTAVGNLEAGQESVSDSAGISMFADSMWFFLQTKEMKEHGEILVSIEKNRMTGATYSFKIGVDYTKMRFEDRFLSPADLQVAQANGIITHTEQNINISTGLEDLLPTNDLDSLLN